METEKKEKKPYEPPTLTVVDIEHKVNLLCGSCEDYGDNPEIDDDFG
jgi:hypothetical protein